MTEAEFIDCTDRYCVIGAGCCGLIAAKNLLAEGLRVEILEQHSDLGGVWNYGAPSGRVYQSTRMISSKRPTEMPDFPMPREFPHYPHHTQVMEYFRPYADKFRLHDVIRFGCRIERVEPFDNAQAWDVTLAGGAVRRYRGVVIASGHHREPAVPTYPGTFTGEVIHSSEYSRPDVLIGKRVLVVGGGNSGCDIAVEAAQNAAKSSISLRRGYYYIPKFVFGAPSDRGGDRLLKLRLPLWMRRLFVLSLLRVSVGPFRRLGLPTPDHKLFESHPVINSLLPYYVGHGAISVRPDIARLDGNRVHFIDGTAEEVDLLVYATGYQLQFPFIADRWLNVQDGWPRLHKHAFHPELDNLMLAGMIQPDGGLWGVVHWQTRVMALFLRAQEMGAAAADEFRRLEQRVQEDHSGGIRYQRTPRHFLEVEHWSYRRELERLAAKMERQLGPSRQTSQTAEAGKTREAAPYRQKGAVPAIREAEGSQSRG